MDVKKNNKGFSLVELIVVIAIMAVLIGITVLSLSLLLGTQARECAQKVSSQLNQTKTGCMSRFDEKMKLSYCAKGSDAAITSDGYYTINSVYTINDEAESVPLGQKDIKRMGNARVKIVIGLSDGTSLELGKDNSVIISFDRATGAMDPIVINDEQKTVYPQKITFSSGLRTYTITITAKTGKHTLT